MSAASAAIVAHQAEHDEVAVPAVHLVEASARDDVRTRQVQQAVFGDGRRQRAQHDVAQAGGRHRARHRRFDGGAIVGAGKYTGHGAPGACGSLSSRAATGRSAGVRVSRGHASRMYARSRATRAGASASAARIGRARRRRTGRAARPRRRAMPLEPSSRSPSPREAGRGRGEGSARHRCAALLTRSRASGRAPPARRRSPRIGGDDQLAVGARGQRDHRLLQHVAAEVRDATRARRVVVADALVERRGRHARAADRDDLVAERQPGAPRGRVGDDVADHRALGPQRDARPRARAPRAHAVAIGRRAIALVPRGARRHRQPGAPPQRRQRQLVACRGRSWSKKRVEPPPARSPPPRRARRPR